MSDIDRSSYAVLETLGEPILIPALDDPAEYDPEGFDPHDVTHNLFNCRTCARKILVMAHLRTGFCSQVCRDRWDVIIETYEEANKPSWCEVCGVGMLPADVGSSGVQWNEECHPDEPWALCQEHTHQLAGGE